MAACPSCGQGSLRFHTSRIGLALSLLFGAGLLGFGGWGLSQALVYLDPAKADSLIWILHLLFGLLIAGIAVIPIALGLVLLWRVPVYQCSHCWRQFQRSWLGGWQSRI